MQKTIYWFRNDLRLHDNESLLKATQLGEVVSVYVFDERQFAETSLGFKKTGALRTKFLIESVADLRESLRKLGSDLVVKIGKPEIIVAEIAEKIDAKFVFAAQEATSEETICDQKLRENLAKSNAELRLCWQSTLFHRDDIPFHINNLPDIFTEFRKAVEKQSRVRPCVPRPSKFSQFSDESNLPTLKTFGFDEDTKADNRSVLQFIGGETEALKRLNTYIWTQDLLKVYKETRNGLIGADYSSKFSAWLGSGCISPRKIYEEVQKYERSRVKNQSTYWLIFELIWRDYFRFVALKFGDKIFKVEGIREEKIDWKDDKINFHKWLNGETGVPFVDANMRELKLTGFMSNRGRQNVASFLTKDLKIDWRWGARWFESQLVDYDVASNWGNWCYIAGVGNDPRENRYFSILKQANNYDANGDYVKLWLPELKDVPLKNLHITADLAKTYGVDYPKAIVNPEKWLRKFER